MTRPTALILGSTGRLGQLLRWAWGRTPPAAFTPLWQVRRPIRFPDEIHIDSISDQTRLAAAVADSAVVLDLTGKTTGSVAELALNSTLAQATLDAAAGMDAHVFLASSGSVYGPVTTPASEDTPPAPANAYGAAKVAMEALARPYSTATCLRIGNVAGADALLSPVPRTGIILDKWPDGATPVRAYLGPATFANVITSLLTHALQGTPLPRVLNVATPQGTAMGDLLDAANLPWTPRPAPDTALASVTLDTTRLQALHSFGPDDHTAEKIAAEWQDWVARS